MKIQIGTRFKDNWKGALNPKQYKVLDIDVEDNSITVEVKKLGFSSSRYNPVKLEIWPNFDRLYLYFELGDYAEL